MIWHFPKPITSEIPVGATAGIGCLGTLVIFEVGSARTMQSTGTVAS